MSGELLFLLAIIAAVAIGGVIVRQRKKQRGITRKDWNRFYLDPEVEQALAEDRALRNAARDAGILTTEEESRLELERLQKLITDRKKIAWETDISYHVWNLYRSHFRSMGPHIINPLDHNGKWYELKLLKNSRLNDVKKFEFELSGVHYRFEEDEDRQAISNNIKLFNLCLYDEADRCLVDIPMKLRVDEFGKSYSISSDSPKAFILGPWIKDFINVSLKHQNIRNQEIRAQKHEERLREIEELKDKFGIAD
jgi:hypothetical protein